MQSGIINSGQVKMSIFSLFHDWLVHVIGCPCVSTIHSLYVEENCVCQLNVAKSQKWNMACGPMCNYCLELYYKKCTLQIIPLLSAENSQAFDVCGVLICKKVIASVGIIEIMVFFVT